MSERVAATESDYPEHTLFSKHRPYEIRIIIKTEYEATGQATASHYNIILRHLP